MNNPNTPQTWIHSNTRTPCTCYDLNHNWTRDERRALADMVKGMREHVSIVPCYDGPWGSVATLDYIKGQIKHAQRQLAPCPGRLTGWHCGTQQ